MKKRPGKTHTFQPRFPLISSITSSYCVCLCPLSAGIPIRDAHTSFLPLLTMRERPVPISVQHMTLLVGSQLIGDPSWHSPAEATVQPTHFILGGYLTADCQGGGCYPSLTMPFGQVGVSPKELHQAQWRSPPPQPCRLQVLLGVKTFMKQIVAGKQASKQASKQ